MPEHQISLAESEHFQVVQEMHDGQASFLVEEGLVRLLLATRLHQAIAPGPERPQEATTLAVYIDDVAAQSLLRDLTAIGRAVGWLPQSKA